MPHYLATARLELDAGDELEAYRRVAAALEALGEPGLVAVDQVGEFRRPVRSPSGVADVGGGGLYRTLFEIEVLSDGPCADLEDLAAIHHAITDGDCSGQLRQVSCERVSRARMRALLLAQGSDPGFLLDAGHDDEQVDEGAEQDAAAIVAGNLERLASLGVVDLARVRPADRVALLGVVEVAGHEGPHLWVDAAHPTRRAAVDGIWPDGVNPLPCLLVDLAVSDAVLERIDYHPVAGMTVGTDRIAVEGAGVDEVLELLGD